MTTTTAPSAAPESGGVRTSPGEWPIVADTISRTIRRALCLGSGRPELGELAEVAEDLRGHVELLLVEARERAGCQSPTGCEVHHITARFDGIEQQTRRGLGDGALSAHVHVHQLARDCQWLLAHYTAREGW
ncbi:DUF6415 family natural product biosynthesis protein [Streptomyces sp. GS7]|uniref:DUF6415 family natural product biosynthesis protein n=1 Tax=Streptomyces sp. GS7 TaxID=2692234 RepID=UPI001316B747|nr:DUF6415 family natural product biosynthesis protein [Streptomyces sp. GS7]QHC25778.1 hypothetical protein GR130_34740 [Streptomyces sp. GS7]